MIQGIHHVSISTGDPDRALAFHRELLGLCDHGIAHLCLQVDDIEGEYRRLSQAGMHFHHPPVQNDGAKATCGRDPDGNAIELIEFQRPGEPLALAAGGNDGR